MIEYPNLYKYDSLGNIRQWRMEIEGDKYRTVSGIKDGALVESEWTIAEAKNAGRANATTAAKQAEKEVEAKYKKQKKEGYNESLLLAGAEYVEPMLAKKYYDYVGKVNFYDGTWGMQCKFNGVRCVITKDGMFSRKGEKYITCPHIFEALKDFFEEHPDAVLDGELFNEEYRQQLNKITSLCRKTVHITEQDLEDAKNLIKYYVYDGYNESGVNNKNAPYSQRKLWIDSEIKHYNYCEVVHTEPLKKAADMDVYFSSLVAQGHEGIMLRNLRGAYEHKRSKNLLKMKPEDDAEFLLLDIQEGLGNWAGKAKRILLRDDSGNEFAASFKGSMEEAIVCLSRKSEWIGKMVTIKYNGFTGLGIPNYAQFDYNNQATP